MRWNKRRITQNQEGPAGAFPQQIPPVLLSAKNDYSPPNLKFNPSATAVMLLLIFTS